MKTVLGAAVAALLLTAPAQAAFITLGGQQWTTTGVDNLVLTPTVPSGNQPQNIQCVICGDHQPQQQADFGYTDFHNTGQPNQTLTYFSTNVAGGGNPGLDALGIPYDGSFLRAYLLAGGDPTLTFNIGIDTNDTGNAQILNSFFLLNVTTHTVLSAFTTPTAILSQNNGTGFPDYTLGTFNITLGTDIHVGDQLAFFARVTNANDGPDSFFIVPQVQAVPLPAVGSGFPMLIAGIGGLVALQRRRKARRLATA
jgi:hypothetical protein